MLKVFPVVEFMLSLNEKSLNIFHGQCYWWMGCFGCLSPKRSWGCGNVPWLYKLSLRAGHMTSHVRKAIVAQALRLQHKLYTKKIVRGKVRTSKMDTCAPSAHLGRGRIFPADSALVPASRSSSICDDPGHMDSCDKVRMQR
ncbi:hypothetical protein AK812_SmicGene14506 [Symbiodinium microadriaticum]|uniref:Uncharacterized protein n=1 Tax=Symbiodinium microadriaticum TaxID=2951 RepID=A0A1Q9E5E8_SYMMI|nr:hypothetical protein AK812_SmicGene14506 [Symbiodinium microadriaticum]CAE7887955.1 unnamed protein product [Symbiodinium microadriaticum]